MSENELCRFWGFIVAVALMTLAGVGTASASAKETVLYSFACGTDGCGPAGTLARDAAGNLYGATATGGNLACSVAESYGCGTVFELTPNSGGGWTETVLYSFTAGTDGALPYSGVVLDASGNLYGTTSLGGGGTLCGYGALGCGTVFKLTYSNGGWTETVLYSFSGGTDGSNPISGLVLDKVGNLYGTTVTGGGRAYGTVFELSPISGGWTESVLYSFTNGSDGYAPESSVVFDHLGNLYGTAEVGLYGGGTVFRLAPSASGWTESTIWSFSGGYDGSGPTGVIVHEGALYGTTSAGGDYNLGTAFQLTPAIGNWTMNVIHAFTGGNDGGEPLAGLVAGQRDLYGTTLYGGYYLFGTVFRLTPPKGNGEWTETVLYNFTGGSDGGNPDSPLTIGPGGLFGLTDLPHGLVYEITAQ